MKELQSAFDAPTAEFAHELHMAFFTNSLDACLVTRPDGAVLMANPAACELFGYTEAELIRHGRQAVVVAEDPRLPDLIARRQQVGKVRGQLTMRREDGSTFEAEIASAVFHVDEKSYASLIVRDLSAVAVADRRVRESEERLRFALDSAGIGDWDMDLRTNVARRSLRHDRCFGYDQAVEQWGYDTFLSHVHPSHRERVDACFRAAMAGQGDYDIEFEAVWPDGSVRWLWSKGSFYMDDTGKPYRVAGIQMDITDRKAIESQIQVSEERLRYALEAAQIGHWDTDIKTDAAYRSPTLFRLFGLNESPAQWNIDMMTARLHGDDRARVALAYRATKEIGVPYEQEFRVLQPDGTVRWMWAVGHAHLDPDGRPRRVLGVQMDITSRKDAETRLLAMNTELESKVDERTRDLTLANRELEAFSYRVAHDLRSPLRAITGFIGLLDEGFGKTIPEEGVGHIRRVSSAAERMDKLIDDMLRLARISHQTLTIETVDLSAIAAQAIVELRQIDRERVVEVRIESGLTARADSALMRILLNNLIGNAWKFTSMRPFATIEFGFESARGFYVRDNGVGFDMAHAGDLFKGFKRLHSVTEFKGTGIGLAMAKLICERQGGQIECESSLDRGATFWFRLPQMPLP